MKIKILALGSRGDVQPYIALGISLQSLGHSVTIVSGENFSNDVTKFKLEFFPVGFSYKKFLEECGNTFCESSSQFKRFKMFLLALNDPLEKVFLSCWEACQNADLILFSPLSSPISLSISEKLKIPAIAVFLSPIHATGQFANYYLIHKSRRIFSLFNKLTWKLNNLLLWYFFRDSANTFRQKKLELSEIKSFSSFSNYLKNLFETTTLYGFSPEVLKKPSDWGSHIHISGYWFLDDAAGWQPEKPLIDFLENGQSPIYIGFGSFSEYIGNSKIIMQYIEIINKTLLKLNMRAILGGFWPDHITLPDFIFRATNIPHSWLFNYVSLTVHHGGAGTVAASIKSGKPQIVVPFSVDQFFWGQRVEELQIGCSIQHYTKFTEQTFEAALNKIRNNSVMYQKCLSLQKKVNSENGADKAAFFIHEYLRNYGK